MRRVTVSADNCMKFNHKAHYIATDLSDDKSATGTGRVFVVRRDGPVWCE